MSEERDIPTICLEIEPISEDQWEILHISNEDQSSCEILSVPVELPDSTSLQTFDEFITKNHPEYPYSFFLISNQKTRTNNEFLFVEKETLENFRCDVKAVWIVLANLTLANMDFQEYVDWANGEIFTESME